MFFSCKTFSIVLAGSTSVDGKENEQETSHSKDDKDHDTITNNIESDGCIKSSLRFGNKMQVKGPVLLMCSISMSFCYN